MQFSIGLFLFEWNQSQKQRRRTPRHSLFVYVLYLFKLLLKNTQVLLNVLRYDYICDELMNNKKIKQIKCQVTCDSDLMDAIISPDDFTSQDDSNYYVI